jgi:hypothetical protein
MSLIKFIGSREANILFTSVEGLQHFLLKHRFPDEEVD